MARAYSYDLRIRVMNSLSTGKTKTEVAKLYSITRKTIIERKNFAKRTGDVAAKTNYHTGNRRIIRDMASFKEFIELNYDKTTKELATIWQQKVSTSTIIRTLHRLGYSYKKNFLSSEKRYWSQA